MHDRSSGPPRRSGPVHDSLSEALQYVRLADGTYGLCDLAAPWGIAFSPQAQARFHLVVTGRPWLRDPQRKWTELQPGDAIFLPRGDDHALADRPRRAVRPLHEMPLEPLGGGSYHLRAGRSGPRTVLVCCSVTFDQHLVQPLIDSMPDLLLLREDAQRDAVMRALIDAMAEEVTSRRMGAATVMTRLADVMITRVIRAWAESRDDQTIGWLRAMRDSQIGRALKAMRDQPGKQWSLELLASVAHTSRSVFAERFKSLVGVSPAHYLSRLRMELASGWFRNGQLTVAEAASRLGYQSEAAFSRAFKRVSGFSPGVFRKRAT